MPENTSRRAGATGSRTISVIGLEQDQVLIPQSTPYTDNAMKQSRRGLRSCPGRRASVNSHTQRSPFLSLPQISSWSHL